MATPPPQVILMLFSYLGVFHPVEISIAAKEFTRILLKEMHIHYHTYQKEITILWHVPEVGCLLEVEIVVVQQLNPYWHEVD